MYVCVCHLWQYLIHLYTNVCKLVSLISGAMLSALSSPPPFVSLRILRVLVIDSSRLQSSESLRSFSFGKDNGRRWHNIILSTRMKKAVEAIPMPTKSTKINSMLNPWNMNPCLDQIKERVYVSERERACVCYRRGNNELHQVFQCFTQQHEIKWQQELPVLNCFGGGVITCVTSSLFLSLQIWPWLPAFSLAAASAPSRLLFFFHLLS